MSKWWEFYKLISVYNNTKTFQFHIFEMPEGTDIWDMIATNNKKHIWNKGYNAILKYLSHFQNENMQVILIITLPKGIDTKHCIKERKKHAEKFKACNSSSLSLLRIQSHHHHLFNTFHISVRKSSSSSVQYFPCFYSKMLITLRFRILVCRILRKNYLGSFTFEQMHNIQFDFKEDVFILTFLFLFHNFDLIIN